MFYVLQFDNSKRQSEVLFCSVVADGALAQFILNGWIVCHQNQTICRNFHFARLIYFEES